MVHWSFQHSFTVLYLLLHTIPHRLQWYVDWSVSGKFSPRCTYHNDSRTCNGSDHFIAKWLLQKSEQSTKMDRLGTVSLSLEVQLLRFCRERSAICALQHRQTQLQPFHLELHRIAYCNWNRLPCFESIFFVYSEEQAAMIL